MARRGGTGGPPFRIEEEESDPLGFLPVPTAWRSEDQLVPRP